MYDYRSLKPRIVITEHEVECPVQGCTVRVPRPREHFRRDPRFRCPLHGIYISPSTFEYADEADNLLWRSPADQTRLEQVLHSQRENRMSRERSEDALTWNVFRFLETSGILLPWLAATARVPAGGAAELVYWSHSAHSHGTWPELARARKAFGEMPNGGSEPDLIAVTARTLVFIENKLAASYDGHPRRTGLLPPDTSPSPSTLERYSASEDGWYAQVFNIDPLTLAVREKMYQLMRFWLLGSWLAAQTRREFRLVVVSRAEDDANLAGRLGPSLRQEPGRRFLRTTWEELYGWIESCVPPSADRERLLEYLRNKTLGYEDGVLKRAFGIERS